jgi:hypothetical protein
MARADRSADYGHPWRRRAMLDRDELIINTDQISNPQATA